jgi:internalin A
VLLTLRRIHELPTALALLTELEYLHLGNNALSELPECIGSLVQLRVLHAFGNHIR